jgi:hypothetical protein
MHNEAQIFWFNLEKIKDTLLLNDKDFSIYLGLSYPFYKKIKDSYKYPPLDCVYELSEKLNFHFEDLLDVDFKFHPPHLTGIRLLDKYSHATYSFTKPIMNIFDYVERTRGYRARINLLRKFQLSEDFISNEKQKANIHLITDIVEYLRSTYRFSNHEYFLMGQRTPFVSKNEFLREKLTGHKSVQSMYGQFFEECTHIFDKNLTYRLETMTSEYAVVSATPNRDVLEELRIKRDQFASNHTSLTRGGVMSSMTWFQFKQNVPIKRISSIYNGDRSDNYFLNLSIFKNKLR